MTSTHLQDLIAHFTLDSASEFLFGSCVHSLHSDHPHPYSSSLYSKMANSLSSRPFQGLPGSTRCHRHSRPCWVDLAIDGADEGQIRTPYTSCRSLPCPHYTERYQEERAGYRPPCQIDFGPSPSSSRRNSSGLRTHSSPYLR